MILPGVGAAADAMARLRAGGLDALIPSLTQPVLGICLGMQLLHEASAEGGTRCLGIIPGAASRFAEAPGRPVPHMGWNTLDVERSCPLLEGLGGADYAYFVHSYAVPVNEATVASCRYGATLQRLRGLAEFFRRAISSRALRPGRRAPLEEFSRHRRRLDAGGAVRLIPAVDLRGGRCVRLLKGDFAAETRYDAEPLELLARYRGYGADWLHVVDLDGARDGSAGNRPVIAELAAEPGIELQVGGGLRNFAAVEDMLELGAARAVVGSAALTEPDEVRRWLRHFGGDRIALAFDVRLDDGGTPCLATHGWLRQSTLSLWQAVADFVDAGLKHVLCTDVGRDGALTGPNVDLYTEAVRRYPQHRLAGIRRRARRPRSARPGRLRRGGSDQRQGAARTIAFRSRSSRPFLPNA